MIIKVLSFENSPRRSLISRRLEKLQNFQFAEPVNNDVATEIFGLDIARLVYDKKPNIGERGCAVSHRRIIEEFASKNDEAWLCVLEDDAIPEEEFFQFLKLISFSEYEIDFPVALILGHSKTVKKNLWVQNLKQPFKKKIQIGNFSFGFRMNSNFCGTVGYLLNLDAAKVILNLPEVFYLADDWDVYSRAGVTVLHSAQPMIYEDLSFSSQTGNFVRILHNITFKSFLEEIYLIFRSQLRRIRHR